ncbi:MAG: AAA family ATPase [Anaerolineae bacterium]|nr:AAA family ATPase [Anaerolineae bacterium]
MSHLELFVLGTPYIQRDGLPVKFERRHAMALFVYLAVTGTRHGRDTLAALFWPEDDEAHARAALRRMVSSINKSIPNVVSANRETIGLGRDGDSTLWVDAHHFHNSLEASRKHDHRETEVCAACLKTLTETIALYRSDFLAGFTLRNTPTFDEWQLFQTETLRHGLVGALERLVRGHSDRHEFEPAISYARRWLAVDPLDEAAHRSLIALYAGVGQRQAALRQYAECVRLLERELDIPPQPATMQLFEDIKENKHMVLRAPIGLPSRPGTDRREWSPTGTMGPTGMTHAVLPFALLDRIMRGQLVGREQEAAEINVLWDRAVSGAGQVLLISGEAGIGKTRLVREVASLAETTRARVLIGRCDPEGSAPYAPISQVIRADFDQGVDGAQLPPDYILADLIAFAPQLDQRFPEIPPNPPLDPHVERERMFDNFVSWCEWATAHIPMLLVIEDLHWADASTLSLLRYLARHVHNVKLLLVMTYRDTEIELIEAHHLKNAVLDLNRDRLATFMSLPCLSREQTHDLLATLLGTEVGVTMELLDRIYHETEGNPFFTEEVCKSLIEEGKLYFTGGYWRRSDIEDIVIPQSVRAAILSRVEKLPAAVQDVLRMAAILGREFDFATLQAMSECDEETLTATLEHAERVQLLTETQQAGRIQLVFAHGLIPFALRESLSGLRRQRLHRRAAIVIERQRPDDLEVLAHHFLTAGERDKALEYSYRAARRAEAIYAYQEALFHFQNALRLVEDGIRGGLPREILERLGDVYALMGEHVQAIPIYQKAMEEGERPDEADPMALVRLHRKLIQTFAGLRDYADVQRNRAARQSSVDTGLQLIQNTPHPQSVLFLATLAREGRFAESEPNWQAIEHYAQTAITMAEKLDSSTILASALGALMDVYRERGLWRERVTVAHRRLALVDDPRFDNLRDRADILNETGEALLRVGEAVQAISFLLEAERIGEQIRSVHPQFYSLQLQGECFFELDRWDEMLQIEARWEALQQRYPHQQIGRICFYCGVSSSVHSLRGEVEKARAKRDEAVNMMTRASGKPVEEWTAAPYYY